MAGIAGGKVPGVMCCIACHAHVPPWKGSLIIYAPQRSERDTPPRRLVRCYLGVTDKAFPDRSYDP
jgi:hypothetical protein